MQVGKSPVSVLPRAQVGQPCGHARQERAPPAPQADACGHVLDRLLHTVLEVEGRQVDQCRGERRSWLASFGMEVDDPIFLQWQQFVMTAHDAIAELEKKLPKEEMRRFWNLLTYCAYLNYDTTKDFSSQFGENMSDARKLISAYQKAVLGVAPDAG